MGLFKSKDERRIEREMEIKRGMSRMKRHIGDLQRSEEEWLLKAKNARKINAPEILGVVRKQLKQVIGMRRAIERQLLMLEVSKQVKDQAETNVAFVESLQEVSAAISDAYGSVNMESTQVNFERAMAQAQSMSQRLDLLFDMSKDSMFDTTTTATGEALISDSEIDRMIGADTGAERARTREQLDKEIAAELGTFPEGEQEKDKQ